jgi:uncharacterized small protein (DUF1192 family)
MPSSVRTNHLGCQQQLGEARLREVLFEELDELGALVAASDALLGVAELDEFLALLVAEVAVLEELVQLGQRVAALFGADLAVLDLDLLRRRVEPGDDFPQVVFEHLQQVFFLRGLFFAQRREVLADLGLLVELEELVVVSADPA